MDPQQNPLPPPPPAAAPIPAPSSPSQQPQQFPMQPQQQGFMPRGFPPNQPRQVIYYPIPQQAFVTPHGMPFGAQPMYMSYPPARGMVYRPPAPHFIPPPQQAPAQIAPQPMMPQQQQPPVAPQPYKKREKKPLLIVDPKTNTTIEIKAAQPVQQQSPAVTPVNAPAAVASPALAPQRTPVELQHPLSTEHHPSPAEEMRQKALLARASASPSLAGLTAKMESLRIDQTQMPEVQLPGPRTTAALPPQVMHMQQPHPTMVVPNQAQHLPVTASRPAVAPVPSLTPSVPAERKESPPASAPPPLVLSMPTPGNAPVSSPAIAPMSTAVSNNEATEDRKAKLKREWEEKRQKQLEIEQSEREEAARKDEEAKREEENKRKQTQPPSFSNVAAKSLNEANPQISLPLPTPVVASPLTPTNAANGTKGERIVYVKDDLIAMRALDACMRQPPDLHADFLEFQPRARPQRPQRTRDGAAAPPRVGGAPPQVGSDWRNKPPGQQAAAVGPAVPPLKISQNAWKRTAPTSEEESTIRRVRAILNKLAKDNFDTLSRQVLEIPITSRTLLEDVIQEIFDKALLEPSFGPVYAQLCKEISEKSGGEWDFVSAVQREGGWFWTATTDHAQENALRGPDESNSSVGYASEQEAMDAAKKANAFKRLLLNTCQSEFEKNSFKDVDEEEKEIRETSDVNLEETKQKLQIIEAKRRKIKKRVLGNIAFIGELFLKKMLSAKIINTCVVGLLGEEAIQSPDTFFEADKKNDVVSEDIECICKLFQTVGKEMDQGDHVHTVDRYFKFLTLLERHLAKSDRPELRTSRQRFMIKDILELRQNRWQEKRETLKVVSKEEVRQKQAEQEVARFQERGAGGRGQGGYGGAGPQGRGNPPPSGRFQQGNQPANVPRAVPQSNRFSQTATTSRGSQPGLVAGGPAKPPVAGMAAVPRVGATPTVAKVSQIPAPSSSPPPVAGGAQKKPTGGEKLSEDKLKTTVGAGLDEYLANQNAGELAEEIRSLNDRVDDSAKAMRVIVTLIIERIIEKKDAERQALSKLMPVLVNEHRALNVKDVVEALQDFLEFYMDIVIDSPKAGVYLAQLLKHLADANALSLQQVSDCLDKLRQESPEGADAFADELKKAFGDSAQKLAQVLGGGGGEDTTSGNDWTATFSQMIREGKNEDEILKFLATCPQSEIVSKGPELIEVIFEFVARRAGAAQGAASDAQVQSEKQQVSALKNVLKRLLQNGPNQNEHQVKALKTISTLARRNQADSKFLRRIFELLYTEDIVAEEALLKWRDSTEKQETEPLADFFKWLADAQMESNEDN